MSDGGLSLGRFRRGPWPALVVAGVVGLVTLVLALADEVSGVEESVFRFFNDWPDWLQTPSWPFMQFGALAMVPVVAGGIYWAWRRWQPAVAAFAAGVAVWLLSRVIKHLVDRGRPDALLDDVTVRPAWDGLGYLSGHSAIAFALATVLSTRLGMAGKAVVWSLAVLTAILRMYTAAHLPLDVIGGAALGVAVAALALCVVELVGTTEPEARETAP